MRGFSWSLISSRTFAEERSAPQYCVLRRVYIGTMRRKVLGPYKDRKERIKAPRLFPGGRPPARADARFTPLGHSSEWPRKEKRRYLLAYVREHPEELRPVLRTSREGRSELRVGAQ